MRNPFYNAVMRRAYAEAAHAYATRHRTLFLDDGTPTRGNGVAGPFWNGFNGLQVGQWDSASRKMLAYAYWRAGRDAAQAQQGDSAPQP